MLTLLLINNGNPIPRPDVYAPLSKKTYFEMSKKIDQKIYIYIFTI
jgi:hypothetical protein